MKGADASDLPQRISFHLSLSPGRARRWHSSGSCLGDQAWGRGRAGRSVLSGSSPVPAGTPHRPPRHTHTHSPEATWGGPQNCPPKGRSLRTSIHQLPSCPALLKVMGWVLVPPPSRCGNLQSSSAWGPLPSARSKKQKIIGAAG